eukprot:TRINITY_DN1424_c0_g1_i2.p1 TRINITY_DN1424_c0_g1~~TRINITY_DN1424_c0_g1_i2.p1  ORF type:complete len:1079 (-),score=130.21 TRINITY_DN1424_c0_g1_i2:1612-4767(-)
MSDADVPTRRRRRRAAAVETETDADDNVKSNDNDADDVAATESFGATIVADPVSVSGDESKPIQSRSGGSISLDIGHPASPSVKNVENDGQNETATAGTTSALDREMSAAEVSTSAVDPQGTEVDARVALETPGEAVGGEKPDGGLDAEPNAASTDEVAVNVLANDGALRGPLDDGTDTNAHVEEDSAVATHAEDEGHVSTERVDDGDADGGPVDLVPVPLDSGVPSTEGRDQPSSSLEAEGQDTGPVGAKERSGDAVGACTTTAAPSLARGGSATAERLARRDSRGQAAGGTSAHAGSAGARPRVGSAGPPRNSSRPPSGAIKRSVPTRTGSASGTMRGAARGSSATTRKPSSHSRAPDDAVGAVGRTPIPPASGRRAVRPESAGRGGSGRAPAVTEEGSGRRSGNATPARGDVASAGREAESVSDPQTRAGSSVPSRHGSRPGTRPASAALRGSGPPSRAASPRHGDRPALSSGGPVADGDGDRPGRGWDASHSSSTLQQQLASAQAAVAQGEARRVLLAAEVTRLQGELDTALTQVAKLTDEVHRVKRQAAADTAKSREAELAAAATAAKLSEEAAELAAVREQSAAATTALEQTRGLIEAREQYVTERTARLAELAESVDSREADLARRGERVAAAEAAVAAREEEVEKQAAAAAQSAAAAAEMEERAAAAAAEAEAARVTVDADRESIAPRLQEVQELERSIRERSEALAEGEAAMERLAVGLELREREMALKRRGLATILDSERRLERARVLSYVNRMVPRAAAMGLPAAHHIDVAASAVNASDAADASFGGGSAVGHGLPDVRGYASAPGGRPLSAVGGGTRRRGSVRRGMGSARPGTAGAWAGGSAHAAGASRAAAAALASGHLPRDDGTSEDSPTGAEAEADRLALIFAHLAQSFAASDPASDTSLGSGKSGDNPPNEGTSERTSLGTRGREVALRGVRRDEVDRTVAREAAHQREHATLAALTEAASHAESSASEAAHAASSGKDVSAAVVAAARIVSSLAADIRRISARRSAEAAVERKAYLQRGVRVLAPNAAAADEVC